jgi:SAM-dependent methyltransferase
LDVGLYSNSELNQLRQVDWAAHRWYRFVLSFPPHLVQNYLDKFGVDRYHCVLDPFCGTGTTVVECKKLGIPGVGIEANPMAWFAASVKLDWTPDPIALLQTAKQIGERAQAAIANYNGNLCQLPPESQQVILTNSISPLPLHKTLILLQQIDLHASRSTCHHLRLALAKAVTTSISNLHFGPEVGIGKTKLDALVVEAWLEQVACIVEDLLQLQNSVKPS